MDRNYFYIEMALQNSYEYALKSNLFEVVCVCVCVCVAKNKV